MGRSHQKNKKTKTSRRESKNVNPNLETSGNADETENTETLALSKDLEKASESLGSLMNDIQKAYKISSTDPSTPFEIPFPAEELAALSLTPAETSLLEKLLSISFTKVEEKIKTTCSNCQKPAKLKCGGCRKVFYCDKDCQKIHWKHHANGCRAFNIEKQPNGTYILVASRDIARDDLILEEHPLVVGPRTGSNPVCLSCNKIVDGAYRCPKCTWPMCSTACMKNYVHKPECDESTRYFINPENIDYYYEIIILLRCLVMSAQEPKKWSSGINRFNSKVNLTVESPVYQHYKHSLIPALQKSFKLEKLGVNASPPTIFKIYTLIQNNSLHVKSSYGKFQGLFSLGSLISHSCYPNTKTEWNSQLGTLVVKSTEAIPKGEKITTILTDILLGTKGRRELLQLKGINCECRRCLDPTELNTNFSSLICQKCSKSVPVVPIDPLDDYSAWRCQMCSYELLATDVMQMTLGFGNEVGNALAKPSIESLEEIERKWLPYFHRNHYHFHALKHSLLQLYGRCEDKSDVMTKKYLEEIFKKEKACKEFLKVCSLLDPTLSNTLSFVGLAFYEHHKTILAMAKKEFADSDISGEQLKKRVLLSKALLRKSMDIFRNDKHDSPEGQLYSMCQDESNDIGKWMASVGLS